MDAETSALVADPVDSRAKPLAWLRGLPSALIERAKSVASQVSLKEIRIRRSRRAAEYLLDALSRRGGERFEGTALIDAGWDNPNYWLRYAMLRAALGLSAGREVGVLGQHRRAECRRTLRRFGVPEVVTLMDWMKEPRRHRAAAARVVSRTKSADDILTWELPEGMPPDFIYDGLLKRQRLPVVDVRDGSFVEHVAQAFACIDAAARLMDSRRFDLVVLSHGINFQYVPLVWFALQRKVPVLILYGNHGTSRFARVRSREELFDAVDHPRRQDFAALPRPRAEALAAVGESYMTRRFAGQTSDLGAELAHRMRTVQIDRGGMCERFQWPADRPLVAVYAPTWSDLPRWYHMPNFRDFGDWFAATIAAASRNDRVSWLVKAHPVDRRLGGPTADDLTGPLPPHVRIAPTDWNGAAILRSVDALVTYRGTAGVECASLGKPVLLADRGWYHDVGFARWSPTREDYLSALATDWCTAIDRAEVRRLALTFAGWFFCRPAWQRDFVLQDDTKQWALYDEMPRVLADNHDPIEREVETIRLWLRSGHPYYHTFKMSLADSYQA